jgi:predicted enzyme related to lactoylglutathione lyase
VEAEAIFTIPAPKGGCVATRLQVVFDCSDPGALVDFWVEALGYEKEFPTGTDEEREFLRQHPGVEGTAAAAHDPEGVRPRLFFQRVPEPKTAKNRVHIDLSVADRETEVERLIALGAQVVDSERRNLFGEVWTVMADPEGNEFCVQPARESAEVPSP